MFLVQPILTHVREPAASAYRAGGKSLKSLYKQITCEEKKAEGKTPHTLPQPAMIQGHTGEVTISSYRAVSSNGISSMLPGNVTGQVEVNHSFI